MPACCSPVPRGSREQLGRRRCFGLCRCFRDASCTCWISHINKTYIYSVLPGCLPFLRASRARLGCGALNLGCKNADVTPQSQHPWVGWHFPGQHPGTEKSVCGPSDTAGTCWVARAALPAARGQVQVCVFVCVKQEQPAPSSFPRWGGILSAAERVLAGSGCTAGQQLGMQSRQMCPEDILASQHIW